MEQSRNSGLETPKKTERSLSQSSLRRLLKYEIRTIPRFGGRLWPRLKRLGFGCGRSTEPKRLAKSTSASIYPTLPATRATESIHDRRARQNAYARCEHHRRA